MLLTGMLLRLTISVSVLALLLTLAPVSCLVSPLWAILVAYGLLNRRWVMLGCEHSLRSYLVLLMPRGWRRSCLAINGYRVAGPRLCSQRNNLRRRFVGAAFMDCLILWNFVAAKYCREVPPLGSACVAKA